MVVVVPLTCKLPLITTNPAFPTVAGSIVSVAPKLLIKSVAIVMLPTLTLPALTLPVAEINPPVNKLPPVTFAVTETVVPVCVVALTLAPPNMLPPVMLPVAEINPPVNKLPLVVLAVTVKAPNVPTAVIFVCDAVVNVPTMLVPDKLPPVMLPVADINPLVSKLPLVILPVVDTGLLPNAAKLATTLALP